MKTLNPEQRRQIGNLIRKLQALRVNWFMDAELIRCHHRNPATHEVVCCCPITALFSENSTKWELCAWELQLTPGIARLILRAADSAGESSPIRRETRKMLLKLVASSSRRAAIRRARASRSNAHR